MIELCNVKYLYIIVIPLKNIFFGNWMEKLIYGDSQLTNHKTKSNQYLMLILKELFDVVRFFQKFSTLDLRSDYY